MKRLLLIGLIVGISLVPALTTTAADKAEGTVSAKAAPLTADTPVLRIDGRDIAKFWYDRILVQFEQQHMSTGAKGAEGGKDFSSMAMERLVEQEMLYNRAVKAGAPDMGGEIERRVKNLIDKSGGGEGYAKWQKEAGLDDKRLRYLLRRELVSDWYLRKVMEEKSKVSDEDLKKFYAKEKANYYDFPEKRKIYQILAAGSRGEEMAKKRLGEVIEKYKKNKGAFGQLALEYSDEPTSRLVEGFIGVRARAELPEEVGAACFAAVPGEITPIVHSEWGYHVMLVTEIVPPKTVTLEEAKPDIINRISEGRARKQIDVDIKKDGKAAKIEVLMHY